MKHEKNTQLPVLENKQFLMATFSHLFSLFTLYTHFPFPSREHDAAQLFFSKSIVEDEWYDYLDEA